MAWHSAPACAAASLRAASSHLLLWEGATEAREKKVQSPGASDAESGTVASSLESPTPPSCAQSSCCCSVTVVGMHSDGYSNPGAAPVHDAVVLHPFPVATRAPDVANSQNKLQSPPKPCCTRVQDPHCNSTTEPPFGTLCEQSVAMGKSASVENPASSDPLHTKPLSGVVPSCVVPSCVSESPTAGPPSFAGSELGLLEQPEAIDRATRKLGNR